MKTINFPTIIRKILVALVFFPASVTFAVLLVTHNFSFSNMASEYIAEVAAIQALGSPDQPGMIRTASCLAPGTDISVSCEPTVHDSAIEAEAERLGASLSRLYQILVLLGVMYLLLEWIINRGQAGAGEQPKIYGAADRYRELYGPGTKETHVGRNARVKQFTGELSGDKHD